MRESTREWLKRWKEDPEFRKKSKERVQKLIKTYDKMFADPDYKEDFVNEYDEHGQLNPGYLLVPDPPIGDSQEGGDVAASDTDESKVNCVSR